MGRGVCCGRMIAMLDCLWLGMRRMRSDEEGSGYFEHADDEVEFREILSSCHCESMTCWMTSILTSACIVLT